MKNIIGDMEFMRIRQRRSFVIVDPGDDLGEANAATRLYEFLSDLRTNGKTRVCIDLSRAPIIDSSVIGTMVRFHTELPESGEMVVLGEPNRAIQAMLNMQLGKLIRFVRTESELV